MGARRPRRGGPAHRQPRGRAGAAGPLTAHAPRPASPPGPRSPCCTPGRSWPTTTTPRPLFQRALRADLSAWPLYRARLLLNYGRWLRRQRRAADSRAPLRSAREAFDALGARGVRRTGAHRAPGRRRAEPGSRDPCVAGPLPAGAADRPAGRRRVVEPGDRRAPLPLAPHRRLAPLPGLPEARHHVACPARTSTGTPALADRDPTLGSAAGPKCSRVTDARAPPLRLASPMCQLR